MWFRWVLVVALVVSPRIADACGVWHMRDVEKSFDVSWLINAGTISKLKPKVRLAALYLDDVKTGLRVVRARKVVFDIRGRKLRKYGKPIATIGDDRIAFGRRVYTFAIADAGPEHGFPSWKVTVKRGDTVVIEADHASALCAVMHQATGGGTMSDAEQQEEIRRRIMFYLAWREVGSR